MSKFKPLRELVSFRGGGTPSKQIPEYWNGDIPWASVKDFTSTSLSETQDFISQEGLRNSSANLIPKGHVIIPTRMSLGKAAINTVELAINQDLRALVPKVPLDTKFLLHAVLSLKDEIVKKGSGATVKGITQEELYKLEIAFPALNDQIRIAHLLDKVEGLITQRKQHLRQLDDLLKSVFLEIFGDPVRNEKGWPINPLATYMSEQPNNGLYKPQSSYGSGTKIIRIDSFYDGIIQNIEGLKRVEITDAEFLKFEIRPFDVLVNRVNSIEYLGKIGVVPAISEPMVYESNMMRFRLNHEVMLPVFLMFFWRTPYLKSQINNKAKKAVNQASVNQQDVAGLLVSQPPIDLQNQFAVVVEKVEAVKVRYQQSLSDLEALYGALSQKAFKGELDLSRVPLPTQSISPVFIGDQPSVAEPVVQAAPVINLPASDKLPAALENAEARKVLIEEWLHAYREQLCGTVFSVQTFMEEAQARLVELHPDSDLELGASDYEHIKAWVFEALAAGTLTQGFDNAGNRVELKAIPA